jgi:hypothetical protein
MNPGDVRDEDDVYHRLACTQDIIARSNETLRRFSER